jgi:hypothetical protein
MLQELYLPAGRAIEVRAVSSLEICTTLLTGQGVKAGGCLFQSAFFTGLQTVVAKRFAVKRWCWTIGASAGLRPLDYRQFERARGSRDMIAGPSLLTGWTIALGLHLATLARPSNRVTATLAADLILPELKRFDVGLLSLSLADRLFPFSFVCNVNRHDVYSLLVDNRLIPVLLATEGKVLQAPYPLLCCCLLSFTIK